VLDRLVGLETEYAIRFHGPEERAPRPSHFLVYQVLLRAIGELVATRPGSRRVQRQQVFLSNGGAFTYEALPFAPHGGLVEGGTPECRGPSQLVLHQRAQEALLIRALPRAEARLAAAGYPGQLGLLKNCRDAEGHVYGAQENYEVEVSSKLALYRTLMLVLLVPAMLSPLVLLGLGIGLMLAALLCHLTAVIGAALVRPLHEGLATKLGALRPYQEEIRGMAPWLAWCATFLEAVVMRPPLAAFALVWRALAFKAVRRGLVPFLVTRPVLSGAGTLEPDGRFGLSEKGGAIRRVMRTTAVWTDRAIFDTGNLMKLVQEACLLKRGCLRQLLARRQRLQLGLADANPCQIAEYLKIGTTTLVIDMAEAGALDDAPRVVDPIGALHGIIADPSLEATFALEDGTPKTALEVQRWYAERARTFVLASPTPSLEAREIVRLWMESLDALAWAPQSLVGRLDWVTKRYLMDRAGTADPDALKKIDLRYHELGSGYHAQLEAAGESPRLCSPEEVDRAIDTPPEGTPATARGRLIKRIAESGARAVVSWESVRTGPPGAGKVIRLDDYR
jgi:proteasome accessory factor A